MEVAFVGVNRHADVGECVGGSFQGLSKSVDVGFQVVGDGEESNVVDVCTWGYWEASRSSVVKDGVEVKIFEHYRGVDASENR